MPEALETRLRRELHTWAVEAPPPQAVSARTVAAVSDSPVKRVRPTWLLPAIAACLVFLVAGATVGGIALVRHLAETPPTAPSHVTSPPNPSGPVPSVNSTGPHNSATTPQSSPTEPSGAVGPAGGPVPAGFTVHDLTFVTDDEAWALGTAPCSSRPCTSLVRTSDGGRHWVGIRPPIVGLVGV